MGLKMNIAKTNVMVIDNTPINVNNVLIENVQGYACTSDNTTSSRKRTRTKNHGRLGSIRQTPGYLQKQPCHLPEETGVQPLCGACCGIWCRTNVRPHRPKWHRPKWKEVCSTSHTMIERPTSGSGEDKIIDIIITVRKTKWSWVGHINRPKTTDGLRVSPLGDHMTRKDDKGDQPSGGETTWIHTGATRYGRGQHKTG